MTNREHAQREITRRHGIVLAETEDGSQVRVQFPGHMEALNAYDALFADVSALHQDPWRTDILVITF